jgi:serine/threonine-protein kinase
MSEPDRRPASPSEPPFGTPAPADDDDSTRIVSLGGPAGAPPPADSARSGPATHPMKPATGTPGNSSSARIASETLPGGSSAGSAAVQQVGRYQIMEKLGRNGMATVFRARYPDIGRDMTIKLLHASPCEDDEHRARFLQEARSAGGLSHPNVVVHDVGETDGRPYMAMELPDGVPLSDEMAPCKRMALREVVVIGTQLARALD